MFSEGSAAAMVGSFPAEAGVVPGAMDCTVSYAAAGELPGVSILTQAGVVNPTVGSLD